MSQWFAATNRIVVDPVSLEQRENPYKPSPGVAVNFFGLKGNIGGPRDGSGIKDDLIGVPQLAPIYSFGIAKYVPANPTSPAQVVEQIRKDFHDPAPAKVAKLGAASGLKTIAVVSASRRVYDITLVGTEPLQGHSDYHLALRPLENPNTYRLRDMWVNTASYATDKVRTQGNFVDGGTSSVPWLTTFQTIDGAQYIAAETSEKPMAHWFDAVSVTFEHFEFTGANLRVWPTVESPIREP